MAAETCFYCQGIVARTDKTCPHCQKNLTATAAAQGLGQPAALSSGTILLLIVAILFGGLGLLMLSEATRGVGLVCFGCLLAVWARILQAGAHHQSRMRL